jgi:hypothetical protein
MTVRTGDLTQESSPESAETPDTRAGLEEPARAPGAVTPPDAGTLIGAATRASGARRAGYPHAIPDQRRAIHPSIAHSNQNVFAAVHGEGKGDRDRRSLDKAALG